MILLLALLILGNHHAPAGGPVHCPGTVTGHPAGRSWHASKVAGLRGCHWIPVAECWNRARDEQRTVRGAPARCPRAFPVVAHGGVRVRRGRRLAVSWLWPQHRYATAIGVAENAARKASAAAIIGVRPGPFPWRRA